MCALDMNAISRSITQRGVLTIADESWDFATLPQWHASC
jgi:hypothetical protein